MSISNKAAGNARTLLRNSAGWLWAASSLGLTVLAAMPGAATANPAGGTVTSGSATIGVPSAKTTTVDQSSEGVVIDWSSFDIGKGQTTNFVQPNAQAIAINRIGGSNPSQIFGTLDANGRLVLIDGNGMVFGKGASVNVGSLVATSTGGSDSNLLAGKFTKAGNQNASIVNEGLISASQGGFVALVAPSVTNAGTVKAQLGTVALGGANKFTVDFAGDGLVSFAARGTGPASVTNTGRLSGANVSLTARAAEGVATGVVNVGGVIFAQDAHQVGGNIVLDAGNGGNVSVSNAKLDASGANGGGTIAVGYSGDSLASTVTIDKGASLSADATQSGKGGSVRIDSQGTTNFSGLISARGAGGTGAGGDVEVSSKGVLGFTGFADLSAISGKAGTLVLDPTDLYITSNGSAPEAGASAISVATLESELAAGNVTLSTESSGTQKGNLTVAASFDWSSANSLTFDAYHSIYLDNHVDVSSTGGGAFNLHADDTGRGAGIVGFEGNGTIDSGGGGSVSIYYNPTSYATPTNYSADVTVAGGGALMAYMLVNNVNDLEAIGASPMTLGGIYALGRDINATATSGWNGGFGFAPVGSPELPFTGTLDGLGFTIKNLFINLGAGTANPGDDVGLFGEIGQGGVVSNLTLKGVNISGYNYTGALAGVNLGDIENVATTGTVIGYNDAGGLAGWSTGSIVGSSSAATVTGSNYIGGLVGYSDGTIEQESYATGDVSGNAYIGGLVGDNDTAGTIEDSHAAGEAGGNEDLGGLAGENAGLIEGTIVGNSYTSYATGKVTGSTTSPSNTIGGFVGDNTGTIMSVKATGAVSGADEVGGLVGTNDGSDGYGLIEQSRATGSVTSTGEALGTGGLAGDNVNGGEIEDSSASGTVNGVGNVGGLVGINGAADVTADITNSSASGAVGAPTAADVENGVGGLVGTNYGNIEGSHATGAVSGNQTDIGGLVGDNDFGSIKASATEKSYATGDVAPGNSVNSGGLAGLNNGGTIMNAYATGSVTSDDSSDAGGLVGTNSGGTIDASYATGAIDANGDAGGLVGMNEDISATEVGVVESSEASGTVVANADAGGLVGENYAVIKSSRASGMVTVDQDGFYSGGLSGDNYGAITNSYATGNVSGISGSAGGLVGLNAGDITGSHASGDASGTLYTAVGQESSDVGGLVADNSGSGAIKNSYATGTAIANNYSGGLAGSNEGTIDLSFATGDASAVANPADSGNSGWGVGGLVGANSGNIKDSYASGAVFGYTYVGGIAGHWQGSDELLKDSYSTGAVTAGCSGGYTNGCLVGGSIGGIAGGPPISGFLNVYWDTDTGNNAGLSAVGGYCLGGYCHDANGYVQGIQGLTTAQLESGLPTGFDSMIWGSDPTINNGLPYLLGIPVADQ
jgi:filamentous hemagglutinin family protein